MKKVSILLLSILMHGCQQAPHVQQDVDIFPDYHVAAPIALFATYPSQAMVDLCDDKNVSPEPCEQDPLSGTLFVEQLTQTGWFDAVLPATNAADYELLIATLSAQIPADATAAQPQAASVLGVQQHGQTTRPLYLTELTVQWRGIEIASRIFQTPLQGSSSDQKIVEKVLQDWWQLAVKQKVFSAAYLFDVLGASDYKNDMTLPQHIQKFVILDTQLYPDPFKGVISRYIHPEYEGALLDITVAPIVTSMTEPQQARLTAALQNNLAEASRMAEAQGLTLTIDAPIAPFIVNDEESHRYSGYRIAVRAESEATEAIYATTYAFEMKDKLVTLSTTFPARIADELISEALPMITVPGPSPLMQTLRKFASQ
ncbi:hypothetical protein [Alteromonas sp. C1M14]|uniref:hypothetical protein n=1 Tax=Alteromonas sp. C1M14 TaxID=2841567 RepID=UPI001C0A0DE6|nr:hypothetical protein [Alteromonas sp. C1M14]MBU2979148.1 hypothetical protein [Alteromonas sp. C1M14]